MGSATVHSLERSRQILADDAQTRGLDVATGIFEVADALGESAQLRGIIADPSTDEQVRVGLITRLFTGKVPDAVVSFVEKIAALRWSNDDQLVASIEALGETTVALTAQQEGTLERLENELFEVAQVFEGSRELQLSLSHPGEHPDAEQRLVVRLFGQQTLPATTLLVTRAVRSVRGSKVGRRLGEIAARVSQVAGRQVADVTSARALSETQRAALAQALQQEAGSPVHVNVSVDPALIGGVVVRLGDTLIDSSARTKLEQLRQAIA